MDIGVYDVHHSFNHHLLNLFNLMIILVIIIIVIVNDYSSWFMTSLNLIFLNTFAIHCIKSFHVFSIQHHSHHHIELLSVVFNNFSRFAIATTIDYEQYHANKMIIYDAYQSS